MTKEHQPYGHSVPAELIPVRDIVRNEGMMFNAACMWSCEALQKFLGKECLSTASEHIIQRAEGFAACPGQRTKAFGRLACGGK